MAHALDGSVPAILRNSELDAEAVRAARVDLAACFRMAARLIERLGLAEAMRGRVLVFPGGGAAVGAVADGRAAMAISQISEIIAVPGAALVGPLPDSAQLVTPYLGAIATRAADAEGARALLAVLTGPEGQARFRAAGFAVG